MRYRPVALHAIDDPDEADLAGVPRTFTHAACGRRTHLAAATVRRYLRDPFRLIGGGSGVWCAGCGKNARAADCTWEETGQNVRDYFRRVIAEALLETPHGWWGRAVLTYGGIGLVGVAAAALAFWQGTGDADLTKAVVVGGLVFVAVFTAAACAIQAVSYRRMVAEYCRERG